MRVESALTITIPASIIPQWMQNPQTSENTVMVGARSQPDSDTLRRRRSAVPLTPTFKQETKPYANLIRRHPVRVPQVLMSVLLAGCGAGSGTVEYKVNDLSGTSELDGTTSTDDWTGSSLVVVSPQSGAVLPYNESSTFTAMVMDATGAETDFEDLVWTTNASDWTEIGTDFESDGLDVGTQALSVEAILPDGTVLRNSIGGIQVQHPNTGTYVGNLAVNLSGEFEDFPISAACIGAYGLHCACQRATSSSVIATHRSPGSGFQPGVTSHVSRDRSGWSHASLS